MSKKSSTSYNEMVKNITICILIFILAYLFHFLNVLMVAINYFNIIIWFCAIVGVILFIFSIFKSFFN